MHFRFKHKTVMKMQSDSSTATASSAETEGMDITMMFVVLKLFPAGLEPDRAAEMHLKKQ
jgi:hypothetical protein